MIRDIMNRKLVTMEPDSRVSQAAKVMDRENVGCILVLDNGKPRGLLTDRDIVVRCVAKNIDVDDCTIEQILSESPQTVRETDGIFECIEAMREAGVRRIPVVDERGRAVGIISFGDLLAMLSREFYDLTDTTTPASDFDQMAA